jgi:hypothetical protein
MPDIEQQSNEGTHYAGQDTGFFEVVFYRTLSGNEPVREWLKSLRREDRKVIGEEVLQDAAERSGYC